MSAGLPDFVVVNLDDLEKHFAAGETITLETVKEKVLSISGRETLLPLKVGRAPKPRGPGIGIGLVVFG
jgi:large subunit ribosomal protein L15